MKLRKLMCFALCASTVAWVCLTSARAEDKKPASESEKSAQSAKTKSVDALSAAHEMARLGRQTQSPEMLLAAAHVIGITRCEALDLKDSKITSQIIEDPDKESQRVAQGLLDEAQKMSGPNTAAVKALAATIKDRIVEKPRGAEGGPRHAYGIVGDKDKVDSFTIAFDANRPAIVVVQNLSNHGDIDLVVLNEQGRRVTRDVRSNRSARVEFTPSRNNYYRIQIRCFSDNSTKDNPMRYKMYTN